MFKSTYRWMWMILIISTAAIAACGGSASQENSDSSDETIAELREIERKVMEIHDEVMPKMSDLNNITKRLKDSQGNEELPDEVREQIATAVKDLIDADSLMWEWMYNYSRPNYEGDLDSARTYLQSEQVRVEAVKESMLGSMERGEALIEQLKGK